MLPSKKVQRKLAAIVFTDIVGYTKLSGENEPAALALLEKQREWKRRQRAFLRKK